MRYRESSQWQLVLTSEFSEHPSPEPQDVVESALDNSGENEVFDSGTEALFT